MVRAQLDWLLSLQLAHGTAVPMRARECFVNCADALVFLPALARWHYVEGFALLPGPASAFFPHAWLLTPSGRIVDPTLAAEPGVPAQRYIAARRYTRTQMAPHVARRDWLPLMMRWHEQTGGLLDLRDRAVRRAWQQARHALVLASR